MFYPLVFVSLELSIGKSQSMKKTTIFSNVTLGIFFEAMYVIVIISIGLVFAYAIQLIR